jgi:hypothetical protein
MLALAAAGALGGLPSVAGASTAHGLPAFYQVPAGATDHPAGTLLKAEKVAEPAYDGTVERVMYVSEGDQGHKAAVTGLVYVPRTPAPSGGYPVVLYDHGTNGMALQCAPSLQPDDANGGDISQIPAVINPLLDRGWEFMASDYVGEGTPPGILPYLVGGISAKDSTDIVLAARHLKGAEPSSDYIVWGHSEGGQTAMYDWEQGPTYGSRDGLHLEGVVAGAPPSQFYAIYQALTTSPYRFYLFMAGVGFNQAYGSKAAPMSEILTPTAEKLIPDLKKGCFGYLESTLDHYSLAQLVKVNPFTVPAWKTLLDQNDPGTFTAANDVPLLIYQGGSDEQIPVVSTQLLAAHLCGLGQDLERWIYPGRDHTGVIPVAYGDLVHWMADRFAGQPDPDPYQPTGEAGVQTTTCPS